MKKYKKSFKEGKSFTPFFLLLLLIFFFFVKIAYPIEGK